MRTTLSVVVALVLEGAWGPSAWAQLRGSGNIQTVLSSREVTRLKQSVLNVREFGALGVPFSGEQMIVGDDSTFTTSRINWYGYAGGVIDLQGITSSADFLWADAIFSGGGGSGADAFLRFPNGLYGSGNPAVSAISGSPRIVARGSGYSSAPTVVIQGDGASASATAVLETASFASGSVSGGQLNVTLKNSAGPQRMHLSYRLGVIGDGLRFPIRAGRNYRVQLSAKRNTGAALLWYAGRSAGDGVQFTPGAGVFENVNSTWTPTADAAYFYVSLVNDDGDGGTYTFDDIKLTEVPDGGDTAVPADESTQIQNAILGAQREGHATLRFAPRRHYKLTTGLTVEGVRLDLNGSWLDFQTGTSATDCIRVIGDGAAIENGKITLTNTGYAAGADGTQSLICVGSFPVRFARVRNIRVENLQLERSGAISTVSPMGVLIGGDVANFLVRNIYFPATSSLKYGVGVYWARDGDGHAGSGTAHPRAGTVENIYADAWNTSNPSAVVSLSAALATVIRNVVAPTTADGLVRIIPGDQGFVLANNETMNLNQMGVRVESCAVGQASRYAFPVQSHVNWGTTSKAIYRRVSVTLDSGTDVFTVVATGTHDFLNSDRIKLFGTVPGGAPGGRGPYYIINRTATTFQLSTSSGGAAIDFSDAGASLLAALSVTLSTTTEQLTEQSDAGGYLKAGYLVKLWSASLGAMPTVDNLPDATAVTLTNGYVYFVREASRFKFKLAVGSGVSASYGGGGGIPLSYSAAGANDFCIELVQELVPNNAPTILRDCYAGGLGYGVSSHAGFFAQGTDRLSLVNCRASGWRQGVFIDGFTASSRILIDGGEFWDNAEAGITVAGADQVIIRGIVARSNGAGAGARTGFEGGINLSWSRNVQVRDSWLGEAQKETRQRWGVRMDNFCANVRVEGNHVQSYNSGGGAAAYFMPTTAYLASGELVVKAFRDNTTGPDAATFRNASNMLPALTLGNGLTLWEGAGTPEAAVTAGIGSLAIRNDGAAGTTLYVKESGTGNTGWVGK